MNLEEFFIQFIDFMAPKLDTYEQAIYLYIFRHSRLIEKEEVVIGFKSERIRLATGVGEKGKPMSENTVYLRLQSLEAKGFIEIVASERTGRRIRLKLPNEIPGVIPKPEENKIIDIETMDFFVTSENRKLILEREEYRCFYCLSSLDSNNYVIEHVTSRPIGDNSYRNVVAGCRQCNNRKNNMQVEDFLRVLYRESILSVEDFKDRCNCLEKLRRGELKPVLKS